VPTLPRPGWVVRFAQIRGVFFGGVGVGVCRLRMNLKVGPSPYIYTYMYYEHIISVCTVSCTFTSEYSDTVSSASVQSESKSSPRPKVFWHFFLNGWEFFEQILHACYTFLPTIDHTNFYSINCNFYKVVTLSVTTQFTS